MHPGSSTNRARSRRGTVRRDRISLVDAVPELFDVLGPDRMGPARRLLRAPVMHVRRGRWDASADSELVARGFGFLMLEGVVLRSVGVAHRIGGELLGGGDLVQASLGEEPPFALAWRALSDSSVALLDEGFAAATQAFPEVAAALADVAARRANLISRQLVIAQLPSIDSRIIQLLRLLADRWGIVTPDGILLPDTFSHSTLGQLLGARRPSVTTSTARLEARGHISRRADGRWLITASTLG